METQRWQGGLATLPEREAFKGVQRLTVVVLGPQY